MGEAYDIVQAAIAARGPFNAEIAVAYEASVTQPKKWIAAERKIM
jgi:hypothetical protein